MTERQDPPAPKFTIRRLAPGESPPRRPPAGGQAPPSPSAAAIAPPPTESPVAEQPTPPIPTPAPASATAQSGALFRNPNHLLAFLGSAFGTELSDEAAVRRAPDGRWWVELIAAHAQVATLVWTARGQPYVYDREAWLPLPPSGQLPKRRSKRGAVNAALWPVVSLEQLLAATTLLTGRYQPTATVEVMIPGALGGWVIRRALTLGLQVTLTPALWRPLGRAGAETGVLCLRLQASQDRVIPAALVASLVNLPYTLVGERSQGEGGALLVDVRRRLPLAPAIIQPMVPDGESWLLGPPELGHWRLRTTGTPVDGAAFLELSSTPVAPPTLPTTNTLPAPLPVQLVARPSAGSRVDAVLLDDDELAWLRPLLIGRPLGEVGFLLPGPGVHLLTAPGGLPSAVPFGIPLVRSGPGALYLELGTAFHPPLPDGARQARFGLNEESAVVLLRQGGYRFATNQLLPAWALWVGASPTLQTGLSRQGEQLLAHLSWELRQATHQAEPRIMAGRPLQRQERAHLLEQAQRAELAGNFLQAAELLERAGEFGPAGRLYERAAQRA